MSWSLLTTRSFDRQARKFIRRHPDLRTQLAEILTRLQIDPFDPTLRLHALSGHLDGLQSVRVNYSYRIVLTLQIHAEEILLIDIGSHDEVYK
jgi:mRNA-degrading endonuclease YafQ of YafQ-DinJ toxin-antitoxin module